MKHYKTVQVPATTKQVEDYVTCDFCEAKLEQTTFEIHEAKVSLRHGSNFPEGSEGVETSYDICPKCFEEKLVPWARSQGIEPQVEEWEW